MMNSDTKYGIILKMRNNEPLTLLEEELLLKEAMKHTRKEKCSLEETLNWVKENFGDFVTIKLRNRLLRVEL